MLNHCPHNRGQSLMGIPDVERPEREELDHISPSLYLELLHWFHNKRLLALSKDRNTAHSLWMKHEKETEKGLCVILLHVGWPLGLSCQSDHKTAERSPQAEARWPRDCWKLIHLSFPRSLRSHCCICKHKHTATVRGLSLFGGLMFILCAGKK